MIDRDFILKVLKQKQGDLVAMGVESLALFGSVARDEAHGNSDVDFLVSFRQSPVTFDVFMDVKIFLEDLLDRAVDLVIADALHPRIKPYVTQDAVYVS